MLIEATMTISLQRFIASLEADLRRAAESDTDDDAMLVWEEWFEHPSDSTGQFKLCRGPQGSHPPGTQFTVGSVRVGDIREALKDREVTHEL
jgi:hypothetical protein